MGGVTDIWKGVYLEDKLISWQKLKKMIEHSKKMKMKNPELLKLLLKIDREMKNYDRCNEKF